MYPVCGFGYDVVVKTVIEGNWIFDGQQVVGDAACDEIDSLVRGFAPYDARDGGWSKLYRNAESGVLWELTYPHAEMHGGGPPRLETLSEDEARLKYPDVYRDLP